MGKDGVFAVGGCGGELEIRAILNNSEASTGGVSIPTPPLRPGSIKARFLIPSRRVFLPSYRSLFHALGRLFDLMILGCG